MSIKGFDFNGVVHKYDYNALDNIPDIETDKTLTIDGAPADAKATGDRIANLQALVGSPLTASTAAGMTDQSKVYVYVGSETGYTNGNWYYYNGSAWVSGGVYNSVAVDIDTTLALSNKAPDSKVVGDAISSLNEDITNSLDSVDAEIGELKENFTNIENSLTSPLPGTNLFDGDFDQTGYIDTNGQDAPSSNYKRTSKFYGLDTDKSNLYFIATASTATLVVMFYDAQKSYTHRAICDGLTTKQCQLQSGDAYFRIYTDAAYSGNICLSYTEESEYVPYGSHGYVLKDEIVKYSNLDSDLKARLGVIQDYDAAIENVEQDVSDFGDILESITEDFDSPNLFDENFDESGYIDGSGVNQNSSNYKRTSKYYPIGQNSGLLYGLLSVSTPTFQLRFYNDQGAYVGGKQYNDTTYQVNDIPTGATTFRIYTDSSFSGTVCLSTTEQAKYVPYSSGKRLKSKIVSYENCDTELQSKIDSIDDAAEAADHAEETVLTLTEEKRGVNLFDENFDSTGYIDTDGNDAASSNFRRTSTFYEIPDGAEYFYFLTTEVVNTFAFYIYNSSKTKIQRIVCDNYSTRKVELESGAKYFRCYVAKAYTGNVCISISEQAEYVPYEAPHLGIKDESITFSMLAPDAKAELKGWLHGKKIVFMGDSIIGNFYDETGICARLAVETGAEVINCAFGGTQIALRNTTGTQLTYWNKLSGCKLCDAIASGDFSEQEEAVANLTGGLAYFPTRLATLEAVDWNSVDILMWEWGINDFQNELTVIKDTSDLTSLVSYYGGYCHFIETMLTAYPHLRLVAITPMWRFWRQNGEYVDGADEHAMVGQLLPDFAKCAIEVANKYHIPVIDNYFGMDANKWTRDQYFDSNDSVHPKASGRSRIAKRISHALGSIL